MIERVRVRNLRCLLDTTLHLSPFTVLIGPNDSGKSTLLDALQVLAMRDEDAPALLRTSPMEQVWRRDATRSIQWDIEGTVAGHAFTYLLRANPLDWRDRHEGLTQDGRPVLKLGSDPPVQPEGSSYSYPDNPLRGVLTTLKPRSGTPLATFLEGLPTPRKYRLDPAVLRAPSALSPMPMLTAAGQNLAAVLDAMLTSRDRTAIDDLEAKLREAAPTLHGIAVPTVLLPDGTFGKALEFTLAGPSPRVTIPAAQASEGALLLTAFLALVYSDTPGILMVEEPENGLHPSRLKMVIDLLRAIAVGAVGNRPRQVIVTTHSPILLNYVQPDEIRVVSRDPDLGTQVTPFTQVPDLATLLEEFAVGELWYLLGEEALLKGRTQ